MSTTFVQDGTAMRHGIDETHRRFEDAFNRGDAAGAARQLYTRDARILPPGAAMVDGRDGIAEYWAQLRPRRRWASGGWSCPRSTCSRWAMVHTRSDAPR